MSQVVSPQSRKDWIPISLYFTVEQMRQCELTANIVLKYREKNDFVTSACWMDEWALGYFCSLRDTGIINNMQWALLASAFQPEITNE